ncbi:MAG: hypothetical protein PHE58_00040 [Candidatus Omnitrophica bacterium]|nr:hypothetical protein [Candidatus Omnitrophota bacterium]
MKKIWIYVGVLSIGLLAGVSFGLNKAKASSPEGETSAGEANASVNYDEYWQASQSVVSTTSGYQTFNPLNHGNTPTSATIASVEAGKWAVTLQPKMVVTKWKVHGHIHFE